MNPNDFRETDKAGVPAAGEIFEDTQVATGDRRDEVRLEPDPDQLVRMRATFRPEGPVTPDGLSTNARIASAPPVEDVVVARPGPSVWDARPVEKSP